jgi:ABC-type transporter Mla subunit MlaD
MQATTRNNILAGSFLVGSLIIGVWVAFLLSDRNIGIAVNKYVIRFPLATGTQGLKVGSPVLFGGQQIGKVTAIGFYSVFKDDVRSRSVSVDCLVAVKNDVELGGDALVYVERSLLGSLASLNITDPGGGIGSGSESWYDPSPLSADTPVLKGLVGPPGFLTQAGISSKDIQDFKDLVTKANKGADEINAILETNRPKIDALVTDASSIVARVEKKMPEWEARVDRITSDVETSAKVLPGVAENLRVQVDKVGALIDRNEARFERIVTNTDEAMEKVNHQVIDPLRSSLAEAESALKRFSPTVDKVRLFVDESVPQIQEALANVELMSQQLKLVSVEVRSQPWRIFYRPDTKELQETLLYDAARTYADAVTDLRAASDSLRAAQAMGGTIGEARAKELERNIREALDRVRASEAEYLKRLKGE